MAETPLFGTGYDTGALNELLERLAAETDPLLAFNVEIQMDGINGAVFKEISGFDVEYDEIYYRFSGQSESSESIVMDADFMPGIRRNQKIKLTKGMLSRDLDMWRWFDNATSQKIPDATVEREGDFSFDSQKKLSESGGEAVESTIQTRKNLSLLIKNRLGQVVTQIALFGAWPISLKLSSMAVDLNEVIVEEVVLLYKSAQINVFSPEIEQPQEKEPEKEEEKEKEKSCFVQVKKAAEKKKENDEKWLMPQDVSIKKALKQKVDGCECDDPEEAGESDFDTCAEAASGLELIVQANRLRELYFDWARDKKNCPQNYGYRDDLDIREGVYDLCESKVEDTGEYAREVAKDKEETFFESVYEWHPCHVFACVKRIMAQEEEFIKIAREGDKFRFLKPQKKTYFEYAKQKNCTDSITDEEAYQGVAEAEEMEVEKQSEILLYKFKEFAMQAKTCDADTLEQHRQNILGECEGFIKGISLDEEKPGRRTGDRNFASEFGNRDLEKIYEYIGAPCKGEVNDYDDKERDENR